LKAQKGAGSYNQGYYQGPRQFETDETREVSYESSKRYDRPGDKGAILTVNTSEPKYVEPQETLTP
jgi:hypothetical protein